MAFPMWLMVDIAASAWPCVEWPLTVGSLDWVASKLVESFMAYVADGLSAFSRAFFVINTDKSGMRGLHWTSVAIAMQRR